MQSVDAMVTVKETDCDTLFVFYGFNHVSIHAVWCFCLMVMCFRNAAFMFNAVIVTPYFLTVTVIYRLGGKWFFFIFNNKFGL